MEVYRAENEFETEGGIFEESVARANLPRDSIVENARKNVTFRSNTLVAAKKKIYNRALHTVK